jgi:hypothetical protein
MKKPKSKPKPKWGLVRVDKTMELYYQLLANKKNKKT